MDDCKYGIDFGTSNSAIAVSMNNTISLIPSSFDGGYTTRSLLYFPESDSDTVFIGKKAAEMFIKKNMKGRFLQSIKTILPETSFTHTMIKGTPYTASDLVSPILKGLKQDADQWTGKNCKSLVLGRPALFSEDKKQDEVAQKRLEKAARKAGFEDITFQLEPIAAAYSYKRSLKKQELIFVADLGAGTSDFAIAHLHSRKANTRKTNTEILSQHGVHIGGNDFETAIMWNKLKFFFGYSSHYTSWGKHLTIPNHIFVKLCKWEQIQFLKNDLYLYNKIKEYKSQSNAPEALERLVSLIDNNLGYSLFNAIENAKITVSTQRESAITLKHESLIIDEKVSQKQFNKAIKTDLDAINQCVQETLDKAFLSERDIHTVFMTGGSSLVPVVRTLFEKRFGKEKIWSTDTFTSVAKGLLVSG